MWKYLVVGALGVVRGEKMTDTDLQLAREIKKEIRELEIFLLPTLFKSYNQNNLYKKMTTKSWSVVLNTLSIYHSQILWPPGTLMQIGFLSVAADADETANTENASKSIAIFFFNNITS